VGAPRTHLPAPADGDAALFATLAQRRSVRRYAPQALTLPELARLLWAAAGVSAAGAGMAFRTAPSAGALYPIETYVGVGQTEGLEAGLYHYAVLDSCLELLTAGDVRPQLARAALDQSFVAEAAVVFVWTAVFARCRWKYGERAYRYICLDAGHIAENVALAAVGLDLASCPIAAIYDDEADAVLGIDPADEGVVYMMTVGRPT
jgi:SagB-type dehydrogenase family enzyme